MGNIIDKPVFSSRILAGIIYGKVKIKNGNE
jgi:hypothetical protein